MLFHIFHRHRFSEWSQSLLNHHYWQHAKTLERICHDCGEVELQLLELDCSTKKRTGEYCDWCKPWVHRWYEMIDKSVYTPYNEGMPYKNGPKDNAPRTKRNEAIYEYIMSGHSFGDASKKFDLTRARCYQIYQDQIVKREKQGQPA